MKISQLTIDKIVQCPADRGDKAYRARIISFDDKTQTNIHGNEYVWVTVLKLDTQNPSKHVWPSHRLM